MNDLTLRLKSVGFRIKFLKFLLHFDSDDTCVNSALNITTFIRRGTRNIHMESGICVTLKLVAFFVLAFQMAKQICKNTNEGIFLFIM